MNERNRILVDEIKKLEGPIAVFGAGGFIGANLLRAILGVRKDCFGITHKKHVPWRLAGIPTENLLYADLSDASTLSKLFERISFKTIFNLASYGGNSKQDEPGQIYGTNLIGTVNLIEAASRKGFSAYVHAGSSSEYGLNCASPREDAELIPNSHYAVSKVGTAYLMKYLGRVKKLPVINLRFYSVYGPYEEPDRLIPKLIEHGLRGKFPPLVDPEISRDFIYVDDAVEAAVLGAVAGIKGAPGESVNIATGKKTTIGDVVRLTKEIFNIQGEPQWQTMQNRNWDVKDWYGDPSRAKEVLNWSARTSLKDGLVKTADWQKGQKPDASHQPSPALPPAKISAVIACYKDAQAIPIMHNRLTKVFSDMKVDYEIIFVNDASPDDSDAVLKKLTAKDSHVIAIEHSRNFGSQSAFLSGMQISTGSAIVLLDGDLQDPPELIPEFYKRWLEGYEVVYGRRVKRESTRVLNFFYKLFYRIFRGLSYIPMPLDAGDFSLMDRKVVNELIKLPETDQFLRGLRAWVGFKQTGVDYVRPERMFGKTTNNWRKNVWWAKKAIFSFSFIPLEILSYFGMLLAGISLIAIIGQIIARFMLPGVPQGISTIIVLILFFSAVQILAISVIGEYLIKIFEETKNRPKFIRKAVRYGGIHLTEPDAINKFIDDRQRDP